MIYALHGAVGSATDWKLFAKEMKLEKQAVACVDLWQFLACCPMPLAKFGAAFNHEVHAKEPILLGYSMGGRLALHALLDRPCKWEKAIIVSADTGMEESQRGERLGRDAEWAAKALKMEWDGFLNEWNQQSVLSGTAMPARSELVSRRESIARSFIDWSVATQDNLLPRLKEITCPVLWIVGEDDHRFRQIAEHAVNTLQQGQLKVIKGCGHRVPWEQPEIFSATVKEFLEH